MVKGAVLYFSPQSKTVSSGVEEGERERYPPRVRGESCVKIVVFCETSDILAWPHQSYSPTLILAYSDNNSHFENRVKEELLLLCQSVCLSLNIC